MAAAGQGLVAVVGAGPYGLATAAHLTAAGVSVRAFGQPMASWEQHMPEGMLLRSRWDASHIASPDRSLDLDRFGAERGFERCDPIPLDRFVEYGKWFQERAVPQLEHRHVERVTLADGRFALELDDGERVESERVVIASGIVPFAWHPPEFRELPQRLVSHTADCPSLHDLAGRRVAVIGGGQSAIESAALLSEGGANVHLLVRAPAIYWLGSEAPRLPPWLYAYERIGIGGAKSSWLAARPDLFRHLPRSFRDPLAYRCIRPAGASWLRTRLDGVETTVGRSVRSAAARNGGVELVLDDGRSVEADRIVLATGYRVDIARYPFLDRVLLAHIRTRGGPPVLGPGLESSVPGLHFVGATAADSFGPVTRFVSGTWAVARGVTRQIAGRAAPRAGFSW